MNRRDFLKVATVKTEQDLPKLAPSPFANQALPTDLDLSDANIAVYSGSWTDQEVIHLLRRTLFGFNKADITFFKSMTMSDAVDYLLNVSVTPPSPPLMFDPAEPDYGNTWVTAADNVNANFKRLQSFKYWQAGLWLNQDRTILEKMTFFWHNHFATETSTINDARFVYKHHAMLRANALGNFKDLVKLVTVDPGMLVYLNGTFNTKAAPDENYARELMELFTLGKGSDSQYTEDDVKAAARVLTGWRVNRTSISSYFDSTRHDVGSKQFSSFFNNAAITNNGAAEYEDLINMIFANEDVVARFIVRKIYRYFVYYIIDSNIETNVIIPMADAFKQNWDVKALLADLLKSQHFYDTLNMGCYIKTPIDYVVSYSKQFKMDYPANTTEVQYKMWAFPYAYAALTGMDFGDPPNVSGWAPYYQEPQFYELWINSDTLPKRSGFAALMYYAGYTQRISNVNYKLFADPVVFAQQFASPGDPNTLINDAVQLLLGVDVSQATKDSIKTSALLSGQSSDYYWTQAWNDYINNPSDTMKKATVTSRLQLMLKFFTDLAEYQLA